MKRLLLAAIALAGLTTAAAADDWKEERRYRYNGQPVKVWTSTKSEVEIRYIPGSRRHGGLGYLLFYGQWKDGKLSGTARLDDPGCDMAYEASGGLTKDRSLELHPVEDTNASCKARFRR